MWVITRGLNIIKSNQTSIFLWFSQGFPMGFLWVSYGFPMVFYGFPVGFLLVSIDSLVVSRPCFFEPPPAAPAHHHHTESMWPGHLCGHCVALHGPLALSGWDLSLASEVWKCWVACWAACWCVVSENGMIPAITGHDSGHVLWIYMDLNMVFVPTWWHAVGFLLGAQFSGRPMSRKKLRFSSTHSTLQVLENDESWIWKAM